MVRCEIGNRPTKDSLRFPQEDFRESKCLVAKAIFCDLITTENRNDEKICVSMGTENI